MPTYEYRCEKCDHQFEKFQPIADQALTTCPKELCAMKAWGKGKVKRMISAGGGLLFKGSGFYITDYRSAGYKESARKESGASSTGENKSSTPTPAPKSTETKPAKKAEGDSSKDAKH